MEQNLDSEWTKQDPEVVRDLAKRSGKILLALLDEMCAVEANNPLARLMYDDNARFIRSVLDGTEPVPSEVLIRYRDYDNPELTEPYPLLVDAMTVFKSSISSVQWATWPSYVAKLEADFANREIGTGRVRGQAGLR